MEDEAYEAANIASNSPLYNCGECEIAQETASYVLWDERMNFSRKTGVTLPRTGSGEVKRRARWTRQRIEFLGGCGQYALQATDTSL